MSFLTSKKGSLISFLLVNIKTHYWKWVLCCTLYSYPMVFATPASYRKKVEFQKKARVRLATSAVSSSSSSFISFQIQSMLAHMKMPPKTSFHSILSTLEKKPKKLSAKGTSKPQRNLVVVCKRSWLQSDVLDWNSNKAETPFIKRSAKCITMPLLPPDMLFNFYLLQRISSLLF